MSERLKVYLAGKVSRNGDPRSPTEEDAWRASIIGDNKHGSMACDLDHPLTIRGYDDRWPILEGVVLGIHDYTGPFYTNQGHGMIGDDIHGYFYHMEHGEPVREDEARSQIVNRCHNAIALSDIVFAWIKDKSAYATLIEIGWAAALGKKVYVASPKRLGALWFAYELANRYAFSQSPADALREFLDRDGLLYPIPETESPMEQLFWEAARPLIPSLVPQYQVDPYRLDFAIVARRIAIEIDGHDYHKTKEQRTHDASRDRYLQRQGWAVVRFTGSEVYQDVGKCVKEVLALLTNSH